MENAGMREEEKGKKRNRERKRPWTATISLELGYRPRKNGVVDLGQVRQEGANRMEPLVGRVQKARVRLLRALAETGSKEEGKEWRGKGCWGEREREREDGQGLVARVRWSKTKSTQRWKLWIRWERYQWRDTAVGVSNWRNVIDYEGNWQSMNQLNKSQTINSSVN